MDYHLTLDMAKELAMVENNDKGIISQKKYNNIRALCLLVYSPPTPMYPPVRYTIFFSPPIPIEFQAKKLAINLKNGNVELYATVAINIKKNMVITSASPAPTF